jgi:hypothetical protein
VYDHFTLPAISVVDVQALVTKGSLNCLPATITRDPAYPFMPNPQSRMKIKVLNSSASNTSIIQ